MTLLDLVVIGSCGFLGFIVVNWLMSRKPGEASSSGFNSEDESSGTDQSARSENHWYDILEVSSDDHMDAIKAAYHKKISQYHPDKVVHLGIEIREIAELKTKEINSAYQKAKSLHGS